MAMQEAYVATDDQLVNAPTCTGEDEAVVTFCPVWPILAAPHVHKVCLLYTSDAADE